MFDKRRKANQPGPRITAGFAGPVIALIWLVTLLASTPVLARIGQFYTVEKFLDTYLQAPYQADTLWLTTATRTTAEQVLGHRFPRLRLRYWRHGDKTAWVMEEIGKEQPITLGVVVNDHGIEHLVVLEYRETRGGEITYQFFTDQFQGIALTSDPTPGLERGIDGITGATLSVRAATRVAILALYFHRQLTAESPGSANNKAGLSGND